jgi:hypothetical protein
MTYAPCKQCAIPYRAEGLMGGLCYKCLREPVDNGVPSAFRGFMIAIASIFAAVALITFLYGCHPTSDQLVSNPRIYSGYHDYQEFARVNK